MDRWAIVAAALLHAGAASAQPAPPAVASSAPVAGGVFDARARQLDVPVPRIDVSIQIDGALDETAWEQAATLVGFSRYAPVDGAPADEPTEVRVWYSPTAIHFAIHATAQPGDVRATLADRDRIQLDDHVLIFLSTFNDQRQATVIGVNPLGVQLDGVLLEGARAAGG